MVKQGYEVSIDMLTKVSPLQQIIPKDCYIIIKTANGNYLFDNRHIKPLKTTNEI
jgi:hypothetical protein